MRCKFTCISLSAALIALTGAQFLTIENDITIVQPAEIDMNQTSYNSSSNDKELSNLTISIESMEGDEVHNVAPDMSSDKPSLESVSSRETRETSENLEPNDSLNISQFSRSREDLLGFESSFDVMRENSNSTEANDTPSSGEIFSVENPDSGDNPELSVTPEAASEEGVDGSQDTLEIFEVVQTNLGPVKGFQWLNSDILAFYDIPYGKFNGYFDAPVSAQSWLDTYEPTEHSKVCPQIVNGEYIGDEDCLTLSIFKPNNAQNTSVLFHIYDGHSNIRSADPSIYGPDYLVPKGVILVLPNYRTGPMGFLCMQNETAKGNAGLKDLSLALEWIKDNIYLFGGNPANIVVSGDGAAGAYAGYLALCYRNNHYVNKVITESGSALSHWALDRDPKGTAYKLAERLRSEHDGITYNIFDEMALETILKAAVGIRFMPCIEFDKESIIDTPPWKIIQNKEIDTTFMIGSATYAGTHEATVTTAEFLAQINEQFELLLPEDLVFENDKEKEKFTRQLRVQYFRNDSITVNNIKELSLWYTDASYLSPGIRLARPLMAAGATVYLYEFDFVGSLNWELETLNRPVQGAVRGDLVGYLFRRNGVTVEDDSLEKHMIDLTVDLWISFINSGKPSTDDIVWNPLKEAKEEDEEWLLISSEPKLMKGIHVERLGLWTDLYEHHFIDNSALNHSPQPFLALTLVFICLVANGKLNYNSN